MNDQVFALFASPVQHSLSPLIHHLSFIQESRQGRYFKVEASREQVLKKFKEMEQQYGENFIGANFSMPNKQVARQLVEVEDLSVQLTGAMNTIARKEGQWIGYNTDGNGFLKSVEHTFGPINTSENWAIIGTGGAARAITVAASLYGIKSITLYATKSEYIDMTQQELYHLAKYSDTKIHIKQFTHDCLKEEISSFDLIINTLPIGKNPISDDFIFPSFIKVADINYQPIQSNFLLQAQQFHCQTMNGIGMLIYQGILAYEHWTGFLPDAEPIFHLFDDYLLIHTFEKSKEENE